MQNPNSNSGFTLTEMVVSLGILAILLAFAVPSFQATLDKRRLKSAAEQIYSDIQLARSEALKRGSTTAGNTNIFVAFRPVGGAVATTWCYGMNINATCDCTAVNACQVDVNISRITRSTGFRGVSLAQNFAGNDVAFDSRRGLAAGLGGTVTLSSSSGAVNVVVGAIGRVNLCSPAGATNIKDYPSC